MFSVVVTAVIWCCAGWQLFHRRNALRSTALLTAWRWSLAVYLVWTCGWLSQYSAALQSIWNAAGGWYAAGVLALCPWVAVLGARRPGVRVWTWFVLLPLAAVLTVPVVVPVWLTASSDAGMRVPLPILLGYAVVLLMGVGNYAGTRYALPAALAAVAMCLAVAPASDAAPPWLRDWTAASDWALRALAVAILCAGALAALPTAGHSPLDRLWCDFRDTFGVVWARRLMERINHRAVLEGWSWRLSDAGFVTETGGEVPTPADSDPRIETALRWFLRRYVDPEWIDRRLHSEVSGTRQLPVV